MMYSKTLDMNQQAFMQYYLYEDESSGMGQPATHCSKRKPSFGCDKRSEQP